jgi:tRNA A37 threonylcarbamoyladenosine dehydratase
MSVQEAARPDPGRRFGGIARLYGPAALERLRAAHMVVVGVGGVGSWAAEALARSGVGELTLIDLDHVAESNINRQTQALGSTLGEAKVRALARRLHDINPDCVVHEVEEFLDADNLDALLPAKPDVLLDCCDQVRAKASMAAHALRARMPLIVSGAAGGKRLAQHVRVMDLADVRGDPLLAKLRYRMRREHAAARQGPIGLSCVCSDEPRAALLQQDCAMPDDPGAGLNCAGYGSSVMVTASFGMVAAGFAVEAVALRRERDAPARKPSGTHDALCYD